METSPQLPEDPKLIKETGRRNFLRTTALGLLSTGLGSWLVACDSQPAPTETVVTTGPSSFTPGKVENTAPTGTNSPLPAPPEKTPTVVASPTPGSAKPADTAQAFLKAWEDKRFTFMYALLTNSSKNNITEEKFVSRYSGIADEATISGVETKLNLVAPPPSPTAIGYQLPFDVTIKTLRVGDIKLQNTILMRPEEGKWLVDWSPTLIFPQLTGTNLINLQNSQPPRGEIKDITGQPLAVPGTIKSVFVVPGKVTNEDQLLTGLSQALSLDKEKIKSLYINGNADWRMPIKDLPPNTPQTTVEKLLTIPGVLVDDKTIRTYPQGPSTAHLVGYLSAVTAEDLKTLAPKGYREEDLVGRTGLEAWAEERLAGSRGGKLSVVKTDGTPVSIIAERPSQPSSNLVLTLDLRIQKVAEAALAGRPGSIVVMNPTDGSILALASQPSFDPNGFILGLTQAQFKALNDDPKRPFQDRPVNGTYPTGSIFKVISASAALERAGITFESKFTCTGHWEGLGPQFAKNCWKTSGHGIISLYEGIIQSCDVVFYEIGKKLDSIDRNLLPGFTKAFGLGSGTGLVGLDDSPGVVPDDKWKQDNLKQGWFSGDNVNLAIGQGYLLATPLQMAGVYAGIATGGSVPTPRLIARNEKNGAVTPEPPKTRLQLPVSQPNLARIRQALLEVTKSQRGTAYAAFVGSKVPVAGKTGTAESGKDAPHAWFACFAPPENAKYVIVTMVENSGEGSAFAAPMARKVIDALQF